MTPVPGYWMNETSGVLAPIVKRYLAGDQLDARDLAVMRSYLRQWMAGAFVGPDIDHLRVGVEAILTTADLHGWFARALDAGIDPL